MQFDELICGLCSRQYAATDDLVPRLLPECGHTYCTRCLSDLLAENPTGPLICPEDE